MLLFSSCLAINVFPFILYFRLAEILVGDDEQQPFKTYSGLEEGAKTLQKEVVCLKDQLNATMHNQSFLRSALESDIEKLQSVMYTGSKQLLLHSEVMYFFVTLLFCLYFFIQKLPFTLRFAHCHKPMWELFIAALNLIWQNGCEFAVPFIVT